MKEMDNKKVLAIIDGDSLAFHSVRETLHESLHAMEEKVENIFSKTKATHYMLFISGGKYFRHSIYDGYKEKRKLYKVANWVKTLKGYLQENYGAVFMPKVEADDLCCYFYNLEKEAFNWDERVLCSPDKDLLTNIPSNQSDRGHFNYSYKLEDREDPDSLIKGWWIKVDEDTALLSFWSSLIIGDTADNVPGIPRRGPKYCDTVFDSMLEEKTPESLLGEVISEFVIHFGVSQGIYEFQKHYRVLHLLENDEDFLREVETTPEEYNIVHPIDNPEKDSETVF